MRGDLDQLARLDVRADVNGQLGVALQPVGLGHSGSCQTSSRRIGTAPPSRVSPSTSSCGPPTMKSVWTLEMLTPSPGSPVIASTTAKP